MNEESEVPKGLGIILIIVGIGVLLYVTFGPPTRTYSPQLQQLIWPLLMIGIALIVGGALLLSWPLRRKAPD